MMSDAAFIRANQESINDLQEAFRRRDLNLLLGAGVSIGSGLPSWQQLVLAMYYSRTSEQRMHGWRPFPNYLFAIAEWHLEHLREPLEITARKLQKYFMDAEGSSQEAFLNELHATLYAPILESEGPGPDLPPGVFHQNETLEAIYELICDQPADNRGVRSVVTYNYDSLLECALQRYPHQSVHSETTLKPDHLPVYHVHGYVPFNRHELPYDQHLVFTEDQYHRVARDPYHWSNLVQVQSLSASATLMIGLSLTDRNMRRLLDALKAAPIAARHFAILPRPSYRKPRAGDLDSIHKKAIKYLERFRDSGIKSSQPHDRVGGPRPGVKSEDPMEGGVKGPRYRYEIGRIMEHVQDLDGDLEAAMLMQLGVTPIWIDDIKKIGERIGSLLHEIRRPALEGNR